MQAILIYLLKIIISSGILFIYYYIALRNKRFHYYNRFYLLMSVAISLLLPLSSITLWQFDSSNKQVIHLLNVVTVNTIEVSNEGTNYTLSLNSFLLLFYGLVSLCMMILFLSNIKKIYFYRRTYPVEHLDRILFINTDLRQAPFSFFNNLFWKNTLDINNATGRQIFKHELTHIEQKHSWDKLFIRLTTIIFWINPFYWLIQKELGIIHEFIADEKAIENKSAEAFALMLLQSQYGKNIFSPAQSFSYSPIKRRLFMLTTSAKTSYSYARRIMVLPLLTGTILLFAFKLKENRQPAALPHTNAPFTLLVDAGHGGSADGAIGSQGIKEKDINLSIAKKVQALAPEYGITVKMTRTEDVTIDPKSRMDVIEAAQPGAFVSIHVNATEEGQTSKNEISVLIPGNSTNSNYGQSRLLGSSLLQAAKNDFPVNSVLIQDNQEGVYVVDKNPYPAVLIECGYMNNADNVKQLQDAAKAEQMARDILQGVVAFANAAHQTTVAAATDTTKNPPLYILEGKVITAEQAKAIDANTIKSVDVLKGENAIKQYGEKGRNGVVVITLKSIDSSPSTTKIKAKNADAAAKETERALKVIDGKIATNEELQKVDVNSIYSISVLKDDNAIIKYGEEGRNGVIEITTNKKHKADIGNTTDFTPSVSLGLADGNTVTKPESIDTITDLGLSSPTFPGGAEAWKDYLIRNLNANIPKSQKASPGTYTVVVSFTVDTQGNLSDVKAENDPGYSTGAEAVRVIKGCPKWIPAQMDGQAVTTKTKQTISFRVDE
jgi:N-acetylmuramoyl-L-alanine amidase